MLLAAFTAALAINTAITIHLLQQQARLCHAEQAIAAAAHARDVPRC